MLFAALLYNLLILGATGYVVFGLGHSAWWFLLAVCLLVSGTDDKKEG